MSRRKYGGLYPQQSQGRARQSFVRTIRSFYRSHRRNFPWRNTRDPWAILVSEFMLQQTQTSRVLDRFEPFLSQFPTPRAMHRKGLGAVLRAWTGLGYNRRAKNLFEAARQIDFTHQGKVPSCLESLKSLPGIGDYTARAILSFAYDIGTPLLETNIRTVYLHHFFQQRRAVTDGEILEVVATTLDTRNPREWYYALMDYGAHLKAQGKGGLHRSASHRRQAPFRGSRREVRGAILKKLVGGPVSKSKIARHLAFPSATIESALSSLLNEGLVIKRRGVLSLPR